MVSLLGDKFASSLRNTAELERLSNQGNGNEDRSKEQVPSDGPSPAPDNLMQARDLPAQSKESMPTTSSKGVVQRDLRNDAEMESSASYSDASSANDIPAIEPSQNAATVFDITCRPLLEAFATKLDSYLDLQDETIRARIQLQRLRQAVSQIEQEELPENNEVGDRANHNMEPGESTYYHGLEATQVVRSVNKRLEEAEDKVNNVEFQLVPLEAQVVADGKKLRKSLRELDYFSSRRAKSSSSKAVLSTPRLEVESPHVTEFSYLTATDLEQSSVRDPDLSSAPIEGQSIIGRSSNALPSLDYLAPDLESWNKWSQDRFPSSPEGPKHYTNEKPEQYVTVLDDKVGSITNSDEYLGSILNNTFWEFMPPFSRGLK